jgi:hypothetical protein
MRLNRAVSATLLFLLVFLAHSISPVSLSGDSRWTVHVALSLWDEGDLDLDEYGREIEAARHYGIECVERGVAVALGTHAQGCNFNYYSHYPVAGPVLASPLIVGIRKLGAWIPDLHTGRPALNNILTGDVIAAYAATEVIVASAFVAATAVVLLFIALRFLPLRYAMIIPLIFAFSTPAWSTASRAFWQHTPSMLLISIVVLLLLEAERRPWCAAIAGVPVALSYLVRPTNAVFVIVITTYLLLRERRQFVPYVAAAAPVALLFAAYNWSIYHSLLSPYYRQGPPALNLSAYANAAAANLISPARGLFVFLPVTFLSIYGVWLSWKRNALPPIVRYLSVWLVLHWLTVSSFVLFWWAGFSYGPRFFTDTLPVLMVLLIPVLAAIEARPRANAGLALVLSVCVAFGLWVHSKGAWRIAVHSWNLQPLSVDLHPQRVWDWSDPPFLR